MTVSSAPHLVTLRKATPQDLELLRRWDQQEHVVASNPDSDWDWEADLSHDPEWREQLIAEVDGVSIGFVQIIDPALEESHYWGEIPHHLRAIDIWIGEADYLGRGFGTQMMTLALHMCFVPEDVTAVLIDPLASNTRAHRFYQRLGFEFLERRMFGDDDCFVYQVTRERFLSLQSTSKETC